MVKSQDKSVQDYMLSGKDRDIVIDCLYSQLLGEEVSIFCIRNEMTAKGKSIFQYECMTAYQKIKLHKKAVREEIKKYLIETTEDSLIGECVHGDFGRRSSIESWADRRVEMLSEEEEKEFFDKLGYTYF